MLEVWPLRSDSQSRGAVPGDAFRPDPCCLSRQCFAEQPATQFRRRQVDRGGQADVWRLGLGRPGRVVGLVIPGPVAVGAAADVGFAGDAHRVDPPVGGRAPPHPKVGLSTEQVGDRAELVGHRQAEATGGFGIAAVGGWCRTLDPGEQLSRRQRRGGGRQRAHRRRQGDQHRDAGEDYQPSPQGGHSSRYVRAAARCPDAMADWPGLHVSGIVAGWHIQ